MSRVLLCCVLVAAACAGDNRIDPSELELRDVLGVAPETALAWDAGQRASARAVIDAAMHEPPAAAWLGALGPDRGLAKALAVADSARAKQQLPAMAVVQLAIERDELLATPQLSTLVPHTSPPIELALAGWDRPGWAQLPARGIDVLTTIAIDAGHPGGPIIVTPVPQLAVIAGYLRATSTSAARLVVNPVLLASLEPVAHPISRSASPTTEPIGRQVLASDPIGNPYNFYGSVGECAAAQQLRCEACLASNSCTTISGSGDGAAECAQLAANQGRGYSLVCINIALAIDSVSSCAATSAPSCPFDARAGESIATLDHNSDFLDDVGCAGALDVCLANVFGPGPTSTTTPPRDTSVDCSDSTSSCDSSGCDSGCGDSGCGDSGSCDSSGSSNDGCSSNDSSGCDSGGCGGDSGGDCGGDSGGDCSGGGADDCSGGGGGNDCDAGGHHRHGSSTSFLWACLPLPFAVIARRRADRRRAKRTVRS